MGRFKRVALLKGRQKMEPPNHSYLSDLVELCHLGAYIKNDVELVSIPAGPYDKDPLKTFANSLKKYQFDLVGISCMTGGYNDARRFARIAKQAGAYTVMGGYHPTALAQDVLADPNVDAVVRGEGELTLSELVRQGPSQDILGLSYKENGGQLHNPDRPLIQDLDALPFPAREIRPTRYGEVGDQYSIDTVYSSRGCIAKCTFCANDTMNKSLRSRSPENFIEELEQIHDKRVKKVVKFWDSIFLFDPDRVEQIIDLMFKRNLTNFRIITESRSDDVIRCRHLMKKLKQIGFEKLGLGIESPDQETFKRLRKGGSVSKNEKAIRILQEANIKVEGYFIIGHSHETMEDIKKYPGFAERTGISQRALYFVMTPYPGTQIYREYKSKNLIDSYDWDCYNNYGAVIHLENLQRDQVRDLLAHCYGSTMGIPNCFKKGKTVTRIIIGILVVSVMALFFYDLQGQNDRRIRNRFMGAFLEAGCGSYRKKRTFKPLSRFFRLFAKTLEIRFIIDETKAFTLNFSMSKETLSLEVHPSGADHKQRLTVTLDDLAAIRSDLDMVDCTAFSILSQKHLRGNAKTNWRYYPLLFKSVWILSKFAARIGWRFLFPSRP